ncbi:MAG TPA: YdjY domain-containing protein [Planctomycetota bacterium]|nr:YdjY domain-containing protein [Planctomycetota bacterium]
MVVRRSRLALAAFCVLLATLALTLVVRSDPAPRSTPGDALAATQDNEKGDEPNPRLLVPPLNEPDVSLEGKVSDREDFVASIQGGGFIFERRDVDGKRIGGVVVPGVVLVTKGLVELFGCGDGGKEHETVVRLDSNVQALDLALTSAGLKRGKLPSKPDLSLPDQGSRVLVLVQWVDKNGKIVTYRSEDLLVSIRRNAPMPRVGWTYVGQWMEVADPTSPKGDKTHKVLAATGSRSLVTTFRDRSALLDNPLEEAVDDTLFGSNYMILPERGTPVRVILRAPTAAERREIVDLEKKVADEPKVQLHQGRSREEAGK